ncbi:MAG: hypothetical protein DHS20C01_27410 [marine bacterium B5-7]|nr:MAG: hypothetical protein DHS20C01_27410 [marine bacterium B5-7]
MTIGIAAYGPRAGLGVFCALEAVEKVATGSIGGYATFATLDSQGRLYRAETQRGGTTTLFVDGETTGVRPPDEIAQATMAGVMSSGPDRPTPLAQYLPVEPGAGLVTGHRLPNAHGVNDRAVNLQVLDLLRQGFNARVAVNKVFDAEPDVDAGIIAVDVSGGVFSRNSDRVLQRPDLGHARLHDSSTGAVIEILHNAISPIGSIAALAAEIGMAAMLEVEEVDGEITVMENVPVVAGTMNRVLIDDKGVALQIETTDSRILTGRHNCAAIYLRSLVVHNDSILGETVFEPNVVVDGGRIVTLNNQKQMRIGYRKSDR